MSTPARNQRRVRCRRKAACGRPTRSHSHGLSGSRGRSVGCTCSGAVAPRSSVELLFERQHRGHAAGAAVHVVDRREARDDLWVRAGNADGTGGLGRSGPTGQHGTPTCAIELGREACDTAAESPPLTPGWAPPVSTTTRFAGVGASPGDTKPALVSPVSTDVTSSGLDLLPVAREENTAEEAADEAAGVRGRGQLRPRGQQLRGQLAQLVGPSGVTDGLGQLQLAGHGAAGLADQGRDGRAVLRIRTRGDERDVLPGQQPAHRRRADAGRELVTGALLRGQRVTLRREPLDPAAPGRRAGSMTAPSTRSDTPLAPRRTPTASARKIAAIDTAW